MNVGVHVIIKDITKKVTLKVHNSISIEELKYLVFHKKIGFKEKLSVELTRNSECK